MSAMAPLLQMQLPATAADARTATPRGAAGASQQHLAWQREMERAESEAWFKTLIEDRAAAACSAPALTPSLPAAPAIEAPKSPVESAPAATSGENRSDSPPATRSESNIDRDGRHAGPPQIASPNQASASGVAETNLSAGETAPVAITAVVVAATATLATRNASGAAITRLGPLTGLQSPIFELAALAPRNTTFEAITRPVPLAGFQEPISSPASLAPLPVQVPQTKASPPAAASLLQPAPTSPRPPAASPRAVGERLTGAIVRALEATPPIRLHVEWNSGAATVWVGLDAASATDLPQLIDSLSRWLSRIGMRLRSIVCNGTTCYEQHDATDRAFSTDVDVIVDKET